mmetsp:Transcript_27484/g.78657  ORF Transcript_27484/g.78657 Transcript_27484/m.78657 type:complete len:230 (-) Transcript_27484:248-937(-)
MWTGLQSSPGALLRGCFVGESLGAPLCPLELAPTTAAHRRRRRRCSRLDLAGKVLIRAQTALRRNLYRPLQIQAVGAVGPPPGSAQECRAAGDESRRRRRGRVVGVPPVRALAASRLRGWVFVGVGSSGPMPKRGCREGADRWSRPTHAREPGEVRGRARRGRRGERLGPRSAPEADQCRPLHLQTRGKQSGGQVRCGGWQLPPHFLFEPRRASGVRGPAHMGGVHDGG